MNFSSKKSILLLVLCLLVLSDLFYNSTISLFPSFIHAWTQSERYAISLQFLNNGFDIFHPATFNLQTVDGITRMDLPLNEFIVALLMKMFGSTSPFIFRMYTLSISIIGLTFLYRLAKKITSSELKSIMVVAFVFLSPLYTYYQAGFIPCVPAISFVFIGYYYFYSYKIDGKKKQFYLSIFFFFLAAMIRLPFLIFLFATFLQQLFLFFKNKKIIRIELLGFVIVFGLFITYYRYNVHLGMIYGNMFLDSFLPAKSFGEFKAILRQIYYHWAFQYFTFWHYFLLFVAFGCTVISFKRTKKLEHKAMWFNLFFVGGGSFIYFLLMACQYYDHDYYFLDSLFIPLVLLFLLCVHQIIIEKESSKLILFFVFSVSAMFMYGDSKKNQLQRYASNPLDRVEITQRNFEGSEKFLDSIGIPKEAKMLVIDSYSTNIPLYMMNRKGYTVYQTSRDNAALALFWAKWNYVVIQDQFLFSDVLKYYPIVSSVLEPFAGNGKITVYKRSNKLTIKSTSNFLQMNKNIKIYETRIDFDKKNEDGHFGDPNNTIHSSEYNSNVAVLDSTTEYGVSFKIGANELKGKSGQTIVVSSDIIWKTNSNIQMVASISNEGETTYYQSYKLGDYYKTSNLIQRTEFYFILPEFKSANDILAIYFWNPSKGIALYDNFEIVIYKN